MEIRWDDSARRLLAQRDRFTQQAIAEDFEKVIGRQALDQSIEFDSARKGYLTPVAESRYSVVWYLTNDEAVVRAVVPWTRFSKSTADLKARVKQIVDVESRGAVQVD